MITVRSRFNINLLPVLALLLVCGCRTHQNNSPDKQLSTFRVHLEASPADTLISTKAPIYRADPVMLDIEKNPFLTEANVASAQVVNVLGGFDLRIQLNQEGSWILQSYSASNPGRHYAIFSQFGQKANKGRWLAAPIFSRLISDGVIQFTPDATHEECEQIALGLNNMAKKFNKENKW